MTDSTQPNILARPLEIGNHNTPDQGACVIEWLRLHEGQEFSDKRLDCQCPALHRALIGFNDRMPDEPRQELKAIALKTLGTANDGKQQERAYRLADVACREWAPLALEARGYPEQAAKLRALTPVRTKVSARAASKACRAVAAVCAAGDAVCAANDAACAAADAADAAADATCDAAAVAAYAAAYAADATCDATYVAAYVTYGAAYATDAAADAAAAAAADAATAGVWRRAIEVLKELVG
jgi:membrane protein involved in colicin uptake